MRVLEYGKEHEKTLLFLPCTAEPEWGVRRLGWSALTGLPCDADRL